MKTFVSHISKKEFPENELVKAGTIRKSIFDLIAGENKGFNRKSVLALSELNMYRQKYLSNYLIREVGELSTLEEDVLKTMADKENITMKIVSESAEGEFGFGQRLADKIASFGGSWKFIIIFGVFILIWMAINVVLLVNRAFDPYPFILLNLILSCLAALQAPVIMMSQNRQEEKDRERSSQDYMVNLKAELEIRTLHEKLDHLIIHQQQELLDIQQMQVSMLEDIIRELKTKNKSGKTP
jgi:uncharacterized membrane protein